MSNFWNSFPGVLTGIAAIITALAGTSELIKVLNSNETPQTPETATNKPSESSEVKPPTIDDSKRKYKIETAITKYLEVLEEADKKNNINILKTAMSGDILDKQTRRIKQKINDKVYFISTHRNTEIVNYKVSPDESTVNAKITTVYEVINYTYDGRCINYIPETDIVLTMVLINTNDGWIVEKSAPNRSNLSNQTKSC